jgi:hypothetical protein
MFHGLFRPQINTYSLAIPALPASLDSARHLKNDDLCRKLLLGLY